MNPGQWTTLICQEIVGGTGMIGPLPFGRSSINVSEPGIEFEMGANRVTSTYGMPTFQFYDPYGTFVAQTTATAIDTENGLWAKGWTNCLAGLPAGNYRIDLINATSDGVGECVSMANVYLYGASSANYIDDHQFFVAQQYRDFLNREPDSGGLNYWTGQITQCSNVSFREPNETYAQCVVRKRRDVSFAFWSSIEFQQLHPEVVNPSGSPPFNNSQFARLSHVIYLRREPTQAEQDFWTGHLDATNNYGPIIKSFINSDEYRLRFEPPPPPVCDPTWEELNSCQQQGGWWDYAGCWCNYGGPMY